MINFNSLYLQKMRVEKIKDMSPAEVYRVFKDCVAPISCIRAVNKLIVEGLTIKNVYNK